MKFVSTRGSGPVTWKTALTTGIAPDGGLYVPEEYRDLDTSDLELATRKPFAAFANLVLSRMLDGAIDRPLLDRVCDEAFTFGPKLVHLSGELSILELFHGPTCAFKDFGAQFLAANLRHFLREDGERLLLFVATSGDTGSAVAHAFLEPATENPLVTVVVLYPKGRVSRIQELQMATLGHNIVALEVEGSFDECQKLVKMAVADRTIAPGWSVSSANSINIGRLLPQSIYYWWAAAQIPDTKAWYVVPSGNLGNLAAGLMAAKMGLPAGGFVGATNANRVLPDYMDSGNFSPRSSVRTASNAMDVGNPNNFERILSVLGPSLEDVRKSVQSYAFSDADTAAAIRSIYELHGYVMDPHTAVGYLAARTANRDSRCVVLATAHPAKFNEFVKDSCGVDAEIPPQLRNLGTQDKKTQVIGTEYEDLVEVVKRICARPDRNPSGIRNP